MQTTQRSRHTGFTLVELLVVIIIIGILASMMLVGLSAARKAVIRAGINHEIAELEAALQNYQNEHGELPPCEFSDQAAVMRHMRKVWPKYPGASNWAKFENDVAKGSGAMLDVTKMSRPAVLVFWLGGMPDIDGVADGIYNPVGFNVDETNPFAKGGQRTASMMEFDMDRVVAIGGDVTYVTNTSNATPYVYFRSRINLNSGKRDYDGQFWPSGDPDMGVAAPYMKTANMWNATDTFQIISAGLDGSFGDPAYDPDPTVDGPKVLATGDGMSQADLDNQASFSKAATIEGEMD